MSAPWLYSSEDARELHREYSDKLGHVLVIVARMTQDGGQDYRGIHHSVLDTHEGINLMFKHSINRRALLQSTAAAAVVGSFCTIPGRAFAQGADAIIIGKSEEAVGWDPAMVTASSSAELMAAG